ncbi:multidrug effflux MFS transporter [Rhodobacter calidifons]|uniref:Multidrug effflux MFS transporter n=1 Tax=Rhodobacter calidifons TaxID=2715277 RepID=A0ABX0G7W3_9RHOB|nr:multidrug effflux MFS transporter [Rhodobacter calidifons]NHB77306.1 multidrug effflux MFS transporter [Rhodobacter calidifons]
MAMLFATIAISIDAMLPALPDIAATLTPEAPNAAQLVVTSFVLGMGLGTLFAGPLSDRFGRKRVIMAGSGLYALAALACYVAPSLEVLLAARLIQGIGSAAPRTVSVAMIRDLFSGREMARIMSFVMMIFTVVPAIAPLMGQGIIALADWHAIFLAYVAFSGLTMLWLGLRQPETLTPEARRSLHLGDLARATRELGRHPVILVSTLLQTLTLGALFATLSSIQPIFETVHRRADSFPLWFALIAVASMSGSLLNSRIVMTLGMRRVVRGTYAAQIGLTLAALALLGSGRVAGDMAFAVHLVWCIGLFAMMGLTIGNLNALAMEPVGHIAGLAASVISSLATVGSVLLAIPVGLAFNGTVLPLLVGVAGLIGLALVLSLTALGEPRD